MKYLTVQQYKDLDTGNNLADINDLSLARLIARAETAVDTYMKFDLDAGGFEPHDIWLQQEQNTRQTQFPIFTIPVQMVRRYRIQISNLADGSGFFANIQPNDCVINQGNSYVEIIPLQAVTYSLVPVLRAFGLTSPIVQMDCFICFYISFFHELLINTGDNKTYKAVRGFWVKDYVQALHIRPAQLPPVPPVIYANGTPVLSANYAIDYTEGSVAFTSAQGTSTKITADYTAYIPDSVRESTIRQVDHLLEQRLLKKMGMGGIIRAKNADQEIQVATSGAAKSSDALHRKASEVLCDDAAACLSGYEEVAIA